MALAIFIFYGIMYLMQAEALRKLFQFCLTDIWGRSGKVWGLEEFRDLLRELGYGEGDSVVADGIWHGRLSGEKETAFVFGHIYPHLLLLRAFNECGGNHLELAGCIKHLRESDRERFGLSSGPRMEERKREVAPPPPLGGVSHETGSGGGIRNVGLGVEVQGGKRAVRKIADLEQGAGSKSASFGRKKHAGGVLNFGENEDGSEVGINIVGRDELTEDETARGDILRVMNK